MRAYLRLNATALEFIEMNPNVLAIYEGLGVNVHLVDANQKISIAYNSFEELSAVAACVQRMTNGPATLEFVLAPVRAPFSSRCCA